MTKRLPYNHSAFTIIELLVVITILAVLVAVMLPSLKAARDVARLVQCRANLRSTVMGMMNYSVDNKNAGSPHTSHYSAGSRWNTGSTDKVNGDMDGWSGIPAAQRKRHGVFLGMDSYLGYQNTPTVNKLYYNSRGCADYNRTVSSNGTNRFAFWANHWILGRVRNNGTDDWYKLDSHLFKPHEMMLMMEGAYQGHNTGSASGPGAWLRRTLVGENTSSDVYTGRHNAQGLNVGFVDGHVEYRKYDWSTNHFETPILYSPSSSWTPY